jgi:hypothetical protein
MKKSLLPCRVVVFPQGGEMRAATRLVFGPLLAGATVWRRLMTTLRGRPRSSHHQQPSAATLRDLGIDPSEWHSVQAEAAGRIDATRIRTLHNGSGTWGV